MESFIKHKTIHEKFSVFIMINIGLIIDAMGIYLFRIPNAFATGGVTGVAIIVHHIYPEISVGVLMLIFNIILLIIGLVFVGFGFGAKTVYSSFAISGFVWLLGEIHPIKQPLTGDKLLELIFAILLSAVGSAIVFYQNASTGGTDIIAKILNIRTKLHIGKTLLIIDFLVTIFAVSVFGIKVGMYSILGVIMKGVLIDYVIEGLYVSKEVVIISCKSEEIKNFIIRELKRGATVYKASGAISNEEKNVINTIVSRRQAIKLISYIRQVDGNAFVTINTVTEIIGRGFRYKEL